MTSRIWALSALAGAVLAAACAPPHRGGQVSALILENVNVVDVESGVIRKGQSLLIKNGEIAEIAPAPSPNWPREADRPNVSGAYVTPALIDSHVHIFDERDLEMYATFGICAVRNMDGWAWHLQLRDAASLEPSRARLVTTGRQFQSMDFDSADSLIETVLAEKSAGFDWVKLYDAIDDDAVAGLQKVKSARGLRVTGHLPDDKTATDLIESGVYNDIAHAEELMAAMRREFGDWRAGLDPVARAMLRTNTALTTTIVNNRMIADQFVDFDAAVHREDNRYAPPLLQAFWASPLNPYRQSEHGGAMIAANSVPELMELTAGLQKRGVKILAGTDAPNPTTVPGASLHQELRILVEAGLSPADAVKAATVDAANHLEFDEIRGRIVKNASADFILTHENPLEDISALSRFSGLVRHGQYASASVIMGEREALAGAYDKDRIILSPISPGSVDAIVETLASDSASAISREALTSLIWFYMKFGNIGAAAQLADIQVKLFPDDPEARYVRNFIQSL